MSDPTAPTGPDAAGATAADGRRGGLSLRARVLAAMVLVGVVLLGAGAVIVRTTSTHLMDQVDAQLDRASGPEFGPRPLAPGGTVTTPAPGTQGGTFEERAQPASGTTSSGGSSTDSFNTIYIGIVQGDTIESRIVPTATGSASAPVPDISVDQARSSAATGEPITVGSVDGGTRYRVLAHVDNRTGAVVVAGVQLTDVDGAVARLVLVVVVSGAVLLAVLALITWWVLRLGVRPIKQMTSAATDIAGGDLSHRIPPAPAGTEAAELGDALNTMLTNIQAAFDERAASQERLKQFVADASHELRTPVATIRGYAELQRAGGLQDADELDAAMRRVEQESVRMGNLVGDLLELARLDQGRQPRREPVSLAPLARDAAADFATVHGDHPLTAEVDDAVVLGDPDLLHQIVANLLTNAAVHTPAGTSVRLGVAVEGGAAVVTVADDGPGMSAEDAARAFERFHRADPSRTRSSGGTGLGLSIVRAVVEAHGGQVRLRSAPGEGTEVAVRLPLSSTADPVPVPVEG